MKGDKGEREAAKERGEMVRDGGKGETILGGDKSRGIWEKRGRSL